MALRRLRFLLMSVSLHQRKGRTSARGLPPRSRRRAAVAGPPLPRLGSHDAARRAAGTERPHAPERRNVRRTKETVPPNASKYLALTGAAFQKHWFGRSSLWMAGRDISVSVLS